MKGEQILRGAECQIALKVSPPEARAGVPRSPRLSWSGLLGRGDFGVQLAMISGASGAVFEAPTVAAEPAAGQLE